LIIFLCPVCPDPEGLLHLSSTAIQEGQDLRSPCYIRAIPERGGLSQLPGDPGSLKGRGLLPPWRSPEVADLLLSCPRGGIKLPLPFHCRQAGGEEAVWRRISGAVLPGLQDIEKKGVSPWRISLHLSPDRGRDTTPGRGWVTQYPVRPSGWQKCQDWRVVGNSICTPGRRGGKSGQIASCPGGERRVRNTPGDGGLQGSVNKFL